jgi:hypothetical protein
VEKHIFFEIISGMLFRAENNNLASRNENEDTVTGNMSELVG